MAGGLWGNTFDYNEKKIKLSGIRSSAEQPTNPVEALCKRCRQHPFSSHSPPPFRGGGELGVECGGVGGAGSQWRGVQGTALNLTATARH